MNYSLLAVVAMTWLPSSAMAADNPAEANNWFSNLLNNFIGGGGGGGGGGDIHSILGIDISKDVLDVDGDNSENTAWADLLSLHSNLGIDISNMEKIGESIDLDSIDWGNDGAWESWLNALMTALPSNEFDGDVCSVVEFAVGMSKNIVEEANCQCVGDGIATGLEIDCSFRGCAFESTDDETCGNVQLAFQVGGGQQNNNDGRIDVNACVDMEDDDYEKICMSYGIDVTANILDPTPASQSCEVSYGDQSCECAMTNGFCASIDCSAIGEGLQTNTCQVLSLQNEDNGGIGGGLNGFVPQFEAFREETTTTGEDNVIVEFKWKKGETKTCDWIGKKLKKVVKKGTRKGWNEKKMKKKLNKICKVKVNDKTERVQAVCAQECSEAIEPLNSNA